nr:integrase, catalytic region, zinc finger, CCHC-type, peptidase aspartic, catalytic [Tanacetum cinerariifolium]
MIDKLDRDEGAVLISQKEEKIVEEVRDNTGDAQVEGREADIYKINMDHAANVLSMQEDESEVHEAVKVVTTTKLITEVVAAVSETVSATVVAPTVTAVSAATVAPTITAAPVKVVVPSTRRKRGVIIRDPEEESSAQTPTETKSKDKGKGIMVEEPKPMKKKQQVKLDEAYARKLHEEPNQDIDWEVAIDHNTAGFRLDYFKGMSYDVIRPIFEAKFNANMEFLLKSKEQIEEEANRAIESINETPAQKAAKRRRRNEEVKHLEIVPDEDDDVYTEATPLARKVLVVDYQIVHFNIKPHYKIIRADGTHQLYVSFITLLKNFDREDLESLCSLVKERFSTSKPNNFFDDYLLTTLRAMFGRPDGQDIIWKSQRSVHGQARVKSWKLLESCGVHIITFTTTKMIMLVERRYPLSRNKLNKAVPVGIPTPTDTSMQHVVVSANQLDSNNNWGSKCPNSPSLSVFKCKSYISSFVRFGNDHFGATMGYEDYVIGDSVICRVYYVEGLGHNLFFVRKFCDSDLEVSFRKHPCYVRDTDAIELIIGSCGSNLYTISVEDMMKSSPICLLSKASKTKSWLWHRRLNHLNFGTINDLARKELVRGLPRLKFKKIISAPRVN